mmetsp:Transcript_60708/g.198745  ORF Transcript_60708/g.198745 Transcript_60708/m.198745 type:complete len:383 (+) Transcript_60708:87-1235(+)
MAHFFSLKGRMDEVAKEYFAMTQHASDNLAREHAAVISVQSFYRATRVRKTWHATQRGTMLIQRVIRGSLARVRTRMRRADRKRRLNAHFFEHCAGVIQKYFRGWRSRRHLHHFHGRKRYLERIEQRGEHTKEWLHDYHSKKLTEAKREEEERTRQEFDNLAGELHHLVSTKAIAGVYNPPYNDVLPQAFEKPIEQHLRDSCKVTLPKSLRRPRHRIAIDASCSPRGGSNRDMGVGPPQDLPARVPHHSRSASVGRLQKIQGPFRSKEQLEVSGAKAVQLHRTIQSSGYYDLGPEDRKMQQRLDKLTRVSPIDFVAPGLPREKPQPSSVHIGVPHREKPSELRGDYSELPKIRDKPPFFTAMPHDKHFAEYGEQSLIPSGHV